VRQREVRLTPKEFDLLLMMVSKRGAVITREEIGVEVNTIGSKSNDAEIAAHIIQMKSELERIREQVQNIE